jgi:mobilome CxxCx(11)CxxC protein
MEPAAVIKECSDRAYYAYGTTRIFEKRAARLKTLRIWITFLGIVDSKTVPVFIVVSGIVGTIQLVLSTWSIVARWDENYESSIDSVRANTALYNQWKWLADHSPANIEEEYKKTKEENERQEFKDIAQSITDKEKRFATHEALMYFKKPCYICKLVPTLSKPTQCDGCGNY